jgi:DNA modification methylase/transcriptional regulator with XRE-family HTH domain
MDAPKILSEIREKANLTQARLAQILDTSLASISRWEEGVGVPSPNQSKRILHLYECISKGKMPELSYSTQHFPSHRNRRRAAGQGVLGSQLPPTIVLDKSGPPNPRRFMNEHGILAGSGNALTLLLDSHRDPAETALNPFAHGISAGKNTYTYDAHTYHTKVPPQGIAELLHYYLPKGGLVLDPFAGSGMTGVAARVVGLDCVLNELSPAACFISNRFTTAIPVAEFEEGVRAILKELENVRRELYSTTCRECQGQTELLYMVWSYKVLCSECGDEFVLWDRCRSYGRTVREHKILSEFDCPVCGAKLKKSVLTRTTAVPVLVGYKCCGSKQQEVVHVPDQADLELVRRIDEEAPLAEGFYPTNALPDGVNLRQPKKHGLTSIDKLYTRRNLAALSLIWRAIHQVRSPDVAGHLAFVFTSLYQRVTRLSEFRFWGGSGNSARYNVPFIFNETNVFVTFERKARTILDHLDTTARRYSGRAVVVRNSATSLQYLPKDSIDLIFTDPPFGANINYSEMNFLWESWLGSFTEISDEAIMNKVQKKGVAEYEELMRKSFEECYRVLRPDRWMLLVFMNSSGAVWEAIRRSITSVGFEIVELQIFDKQHGTFKQFVSENTTGMDLVLHCLKREVLHESKKEGQQSAPDEDLLAFLTDRHGNLPMEVYLHVTRNGEIGFRTLYSEWLARSLNKSAELMDFASFRNKVEHLLATRGGA